MNTKKGNNRSKEENIRIAAIARAAKAQKQAAAKAKAAAKIAKAAAEFRHILSAPAKVIEKPLPIVTVSKPPVTKSVPIPKKKSNTGPALAARREKYEATRAAREAKKALEQQIKQAKREAREEAARQKKAAARIPSDVKSDIQLSNDNDVDTELNVAAHNRHAGPELGWTGHDIYDDTLNKMPRSYPYYAYAKVYRSHINVNVDNQGDLIDGDISYNELHNLGLAHLLTQARPHWFALPLQNIVKTSKAYLIKKSGDREDFVHEVLNGLYNGSMQFITGVDLTIIRPNGQQKLIRVARYKVGNCVMNILKGYLPEDSIRKVFKKLPHLKPTKTCPNPSICSEDLEVIARVAKINIKVYSRLGTVTGDTWAEFGKCKGKKVINLVFGNGHATVKAGTVNIQSIKYIDGSIIDPSCTGEFTDYVDIGYTCSSNDMYDNKAASDLYDAQPVNYYVRLIDGKFVMFKSYKPSSVTGDSNDDYNTDYAYSVNPIQVLTRLFRVSHGLFGVNVPLIRDIVKSAEFFIGRRRFGDVSGCKEIDMNKCYVSYKSNAYYEEFPTLDLYPIIGESNKSRFYICSSVDNYPTAFGILMRYNGGSIVLTRPVVRWLRDNGAVVNVSHSLVGPARDVDILAFADKYRDKVSESDMKKFRNSLIGSCIAGGISGERRLTCVYNDIAERDQIIHEASMHDFKIELIDPLKQITVYFHSDTKGSFHFHSFILGYAFVSVADMMQRLINGGGVIVAYNTDAIVYRGEDPVGYSTAEFGGWKIKDVSRAYNQTTLSEYSDCISRQPFEFFEGIHLPDCIDDTIVMGPPGISKSYPFLTKPYYGQIFLVPRRELKDEHTRTQIDFCGSSNVFTAHKYFQFGYDDDGWAKLRAEGKIPKRHQIVIIDEFTMFNLAEWSMMYHRAKNIDDSVLITLGDFEQICSEVESKPVSADFFNERKFNVILKERSEKGFARQCYEDGMILDTLRGKSWSEQVSILSKHVASTTGDLDFVDSIHISGSHRRCHEINVLAAAYCKEHNMSIRCRNKDKKFVELGVSDPLIWWGRLSMKDELPKEFKYEPAYSVTADSVEGKTLTCRIYIDDNLSRHGAFYTGVSRCVKLSQVVIVKTGGECKDIPMKPIVTMLWSLRGVCDAVSAYWEDTEVDDTYCSMYTDKIMKVVNNIKSIKDKIDICYDALIEKYVKNGQLVREADGRYRTDIIENLRNLPMCDDPADVFCHRQLFNGKEVALFFNSAIGRNIVRDIVDTYRESECDTGCDIVEPECDLDDYEALDVITTTVDTSTKVKRKRERRLTHGRRTDGVNSGKGRRTMELYDGSISSPVVGLNGVKSSIRWDTLADEGDVLEMII